MSNTCPKCNSKTLSEVSGYSITSGMARQDGVSASLIDGWSCVICGYWLDTIAPATPKMAKGVRPNCLRSDEIRAEILAQWDRIYLLRIGGHSYDSIINVIGIDVTGSTFGKHVKKIMAYKGLVFESNKGRYAITGKPRKKTRSDGRPYGAGVGA